MDLTKQCRPHRATNLKRLISPLLNSERFPQTCGTRLGDLGFFRKAMWHVPKSHTEPGSAPTSTELGDCSFLDPKPFVCTTPMLTVPVSKAGAVLSTQRTLNTQRVSFSETNPIQAPSAFKTIVGLSNLSVFGHNKYSVCPREVLTRAPKGHTQGD